MKRTVQFLLFALILLSWSACENNNDEPSVSSGDADLTRYVAIGNSLSSGFMNNDLYLSGQVYSWPAQFADKMADAGSGTFKQPLMVDDTGFGRRLIFNFLTKLPESAGETANPENFTNISAQGPFNNMAVPGARVADLLSPDFSKFELTEGGNPYYNRFAANPGTSTVMDEVVAQDPTFFTLWIGNNDVLGYGLRGGDLTIGLGITDQASFAANYASILNMLDGKTGLVALVPDVLAAPYFTAVSTFKSYNDLNLTAEQATQYNNYIAAIEADLTQAGTPHSYGITFAEGEHNAFLVEDPELNLPSPYNFRQATAEDLFLFSLAGDYENVLNEIEQLGLGSFAAGTPRPLAHRYILDINEQNNMRNAIAGFNQTITNLVAQHPGMHVIDTYSYMNQLKDGIVEQGFLFTPEFITGGFFSYDGIHPTVDGYTLIANKFIDTFNTTFNATLERVKIYDPEAK